MNISYRDAIFFYLSALFISDCAYSNNQAKYEYPKVLWDKAKHGKFEIGKVPVSAPQ